MKVWILWEESGEYSDYGLGILGVFSDPEIAKSWLKENAETRYNLVGGEERKIVLGDWELHDEDWNLYEIANRNWSQNSWTIAPYIIDNPENE